MKILFSAFFLISLLVLEFFGFEDWLIITLIIQVIWLNLNSIRMLKKYYNNLVWIDRFRNLNKITLFVLVVDLLIIFLSISFFVRMFLAPFYKGMFFLTSFLILISVILNYSILIKILMQMPVSKIKKMIFVLASFFYPIGFFTIDIKVKENIN